MKTFHGWSLDHNPFSRMTVPLTRRVHPPLVANKIVSVQPMLGPTGLVYYLRHRYSGGGMKTFKQWQSENENAVL